MNNRNKTFRNVLLIAAAILTCAMFSQAQHRPHGAAKGNLKRQQADAIDHARRYLMSDIEIGLPEISFAEWFRQTIGEHSPISWDINDCGEQSGTAVDRGRDFPMCVSANTQIVANLYVSVNIQFGSFKRGLTKTKPVVRSITAGDELAGEWVDNLIDLPDKVDDLRLTFGWLDPNGGEFRISGVAPAAFATLTLHVKTMEHNSKDMYVPVSWSGSVMFRGHEYKMTDLVTDSKNMQFETAAYRGISFRFIGKLAVTQHADIGEGIMHGRMIKLLRGKRSAAADLVFDHVRFPNADDMSLIEPSADLSSHVEQICDRGGPPHL